MGLRLIYLVIGSSVMTLTTTPNQLTDGLEKGLHFLNRFRVPVHEISMMMSIALRFIPILVEETDKIMSAQKARGADFESGNLIQKAKAMLPILVRRLYLYLLLFPFSLLLPYATGLLILLFLGHLVQSWRELRQLPKRLQPVHRY